MRRGSITNQSFLDAYQNDDETFDIVTLQSLIEETYGERNEIDFKLEMIEKDKLAKTILAMANSGGGSIIFGISDEGKPIGISEIEDDTDFFKKLNAYLPSILLYNYQYIRYVEDERYGEFSGKLFLLFNISRNYRYAPYMAMKDSEKLDRSKIFIRRAAANEPANNEEIEGIFRLRLISQYEDLTNMELEEHLEQLKVLYSQISKYQYTNIFSHITQSFKGLIGDEKQKNENYPNEDFEDFIIKSIRKKKRKIELTLEIAGIEEE